MLKSLLNINLALILMSTSLLNAQASSCYEENQELTKLGFIHDNNLLIKEEPNAYRHTEERKMSIIFPNGKKNDLKLDVWNIAYDCHQDDGLNAVQSQVQEISNIINHISLDKLDEKTKLEQTVLESDKKSKDSIFSKLFGRKTNENKDMEYKEIMSKYAQEKLCEQKKYLEKSLANNQFKTKTQYEMKSFQVGIKEIFCGKDQVFPEDYYCDITYVRQLDIGPKKPLLESP